VYTTATSCNVTVKERNSNIVEVADIVSYTAEKTANILSISPDMGTTAGN
jgi:hypothetical protein